ncbi:hypothetical protein ABIC83_003060 [Roseateles asaccharophilus]|uniref:hypothetical protein n=1 Tax=Roseateles asaccharophilus TaxID=582607 RepID=UPI003834F46E
MPDANSLPIKLPPMWTAEFFKSYGMVLTGEDAKGSLGMVTISKEGRIYGLGIAPPRRGTVDPAKYKGRGWQLRLYVDAVQALCAAAERPPLDPASLTPDA